MSRFRWLLVGYCLYTAPLMAAEVISMSAPKAQSPLQVSIGAATDTPPGQSVELVLQVWSAVDLSDVQIQIAVPSTARIEQGQADSRVNLVANQVYLQTLRIRFTQATDNSVQVTASHDSGQDARFSAMAQYSGAIQSLSSITASLGDAAPREVQRGTRRIREYRVH